MSDFNIFSHLNTMGFGRQGQQQSADKGNEISTADHAVESVGNAVGNLLSRATGINASQAGAVSVTQPVEYKGWADSEIPSLVNRLNANGGIIAQIAHTLVKNGVIQDASQLHDTMMGGSSGNMLLADSGNFTPSSSPNEGPAAGDDRGGGMTA